ncbi:hypothetical protein [Herbiconiux sp. L3-i23]|uniref:hypothetical protein n=1 Tax=Herbiconiux sp. L3-i23 TaxID=2905871 RepID=UPI00204B1EF9|nr:hypothetical protein [Herbiconiux sp. L3-i23]BDI23713.1 hypothetical protein L3i23_24890 [Herbiconiux sp. L3-i23]
MSAIDVAASTPPLHVASATRIARVMRLHFVNKWILIGIPWIITAVAFAISLTIALLITSFVPPSDRAEALQGMSYSWAVVSPLWYLVVAGIQAASTTFAFALGFSITRREFAIGTLLTFVVVAAGFALAWTLLNVVEGVSDGFGIGLVHFRSMWFGGLDAPAVFLSWFSVQLALLAIGALFASIWVRWRAAGVVWAWAVVALLVVAFIAVLLITGTAPALFTWVATIGAAGLFASLLVVAAVAFGLGWWVLRFATPQG